MSVAIVMLFAFPGAALAATQTAHLGDVSATFTFQGRFPNYRNLHLKITTAGEVLYNAAVTSRQCPNRCAPATTGPHQSSVRALDLDSNGQPDVVLALYTGGAHCCFVDQVYSLDRGTMAYVKTEHYFGNAGAVINDLGHNGRLQFVSTNDAFYYEFASFAYSGAPIQIWSFANDHFADVSRGYPKLVKSDAARWWRLFTRHYQAGEGFIAAWAADEALLGHSEQVKITLAKQLRLGHLHSDLGPPLPSGKRFVAALLKFLHKLGYE